jgi:predicted glycosyltransferase involved in capsule biosynthesis
LNYIRIFAAELLSPSGGRLLLRDDDASTVVMRHNERRLNTLSHYHVTDRTTMAVVKARIHQNGQDMCSIRALQFSSSAYRSEWRASYSSGKRNNIADYSKKCEPNSIFFVDNSKLTSPTCFDSNRFILVTSGNIIEET